MKLFYLLMMLLCIGSDVFASVTIHAGSIEVGRGGANPIAIPPTDLTQYEVVWLRNNKTEWTFGLIPGIFFGRRVELARGAYMSAGPGLAINQNGQGPGIYMAFGWDHCYWKWLCINFEYKGATAININQFGLIQPYAIRFGFTFFK